MWFSISICCNVASSIYKEGGRVGLHVGWEEQQTGNKILRQRNKHIWNFIIERDAKPDTTVLSYKYHGA